MMLHSYLNFLQFRWNSYRVLWNSRIALNSCGICVIQGFRWNSIGSPTIPIGMAYYASLLLEFHWNSYQVLWNSHIASEFVLCRSYTGKSLEFRWDSYQSYLELGLMLHSYWNSLETALEFF